MKLYLLYRATFAAASPVLLVAFLSMFLLSACGGGGSSSSSTPDTSKPSLALSLAEDKAKNDVVITADVTDNVGVTQVDYEVDGGRIKGTRTDSSMPSRYEIRIPVAQFGLGNHSVTATASDAARNTSDADTRVIQVGTPPIKLILTSAKDPAPITFTIDIVGDPGIYTVNLFMDGQFLGGSVSSTQHFTHTPKNLAAGKHQFGVNISDAENNTMTEYVDFEI